ncbi:MAG: helix-turn-helix transcriptional regulator [Roseburia sp.]|nr:helix-turn-helix transcriptional regulator [Roseburia sp.]
MRFSYNKLFKLLIDRGINKKTLREMSGISAASVAKLGKGGNVNTDVLLRICNALNCDVGDIMEFKKDEKAQE